MCTWYMDCNCLSGDSGELPLPLTVALWPLTDAIFPSCPPALSGWLSAARAVCVSLSFPHPVAAPLVWAEPLSLPLWPPATKVPSPPTLNPPPPESVGRLNHTGWVVQPPASVGHFLGGRVRGSLIGRKAREAEPRSNSVRKRTSFLSSRMLGCFFI